VTKKDIAKTVADQFDLPHDTTRKLIKSTFEALIDALAREGRLELRNFGVFQVKHRQARQARNPRTGEPLTVRAKSVVTFKPGKEMEERVREFAKLSLKQGGAPPVAPPPPAESGSGETIGE
jgi:nucleoid DNA-binding protein